MWDTDMVTYELYQGCMTISYNDAYRCIMLHTAINITISITIKGIQDSIW